MQKGIVSSDVVLMFRLLHALTFETLLSFHLAPFGIERDKNSTCQSDGCGYKGFTMWWVEEKGNLCSLFYEELLGSDINDHWLRCGPQNNFWLLYQSHPSLSRALMLLQCCILAPIPHANAPRVTLAGQNPTSGPSSTRRSVDGCSLQFRWENRATSPTMMKRNVQN